MSDHNDDINPTEKRICCECVGEDFLKQEISKDSIEETCSYCGEVDKCISIPELSDRVKTAFEQHYYRTFTEPSSFEYSMIKETDYEWYREGENVVDAIAWAVSLPDEKAAIDIQQILSDRYYDHDCAAMGVETEFDSESHYAGKKHSAGQWHGEWYNFKNLLKTQTRFFSKSASELLKSIFNDIDTIKTTKGKSLIVQAGPEKDLKEVYRARSFQTDHKLKESLGQPDKRLGPPPSSIASAGRMNAQGISVFYGANKPMAALAEIRPPVGCQVVITRFEIIRQLKLLDLTALDSVGIDGSIFDPTFIDRIERTMFLRTLGDLMTVPVMPDNEDLDYLPTQAVADFLASENVPRLDGIIFPSVQTGGDSLNVVLFHKASIVESIQIAEGTKIDVHLGYEDSGEWNVEYSVHEQYPPKKKQQKTKRILPKIVGIWDDMDDLGPSSEPSLKIDLDSIRVHKVSSVKFTTSDYPVRRHKYEKRKPDF